MICRPCGELSSRRSASIFARIAVEDIASTPPSISPARHSMPSARAAAHTINRVSNTCAPPRPNTMRRMATSLGRLNSSPILNIRNTTPISASRRASTVSGIHARACGPIATPTMR